jgi:hypothetical protein
MQKVEDPTDPPPPTEMSTDELTATELKEITSPAPPPPAHFPPPPPPPPATMSTSVSEVTPEGIVHVHPAVTVVNSTYVLPAYVAVRSGVHAANAFTGCTTIASTTNTEVSTTTAAIAALLKTLESFIVG